MISATGCTVLPSFWPAPVLGGLTTPLNWMKRGTVEGAPTACSAEAGVAFSCAKAIATHGSSATTSATTGKGL